MTAKQSTAWLEYESQRQGITVEELRKQMSERSNKADKSKTGFGSMSEERRKEVAKKGYDNGLGKKNEAQSTKTE